MLLQYISDEKLYDCVNYVIKSTEKAANNKEKTFFKNVIDPFSAVFDCIINDIDLTTWLKLEKTRQIQKTLQNAIGEFHQKVIGSVDGWKDFGTGNVVDLQNKEKKIIAEIKNKFNTTKGNHKISIYDDLKLKLNESEYAGYTGYYVEILRQNKNKYNKPFCPPDNKTKKNRPEHPRIKVIDGESFYDLATGTDDALLKLYMVLPEIICKLRKSQIKVDNYQPLFKKAFHKEFDSPS